MAPPSNQHYSSRLDAAAIKVFGVDKVSFHPARLRAGPELGARAHSPSKLFPWSRRSKVARQQTSSLQGKTAPAIQLRSYVRNGRNNRSYDYDAPCNGCLCDLRPNG